MEEDKLISKETESDQYPQSGKFQLYEGMQIDHREEDKTVKLLFLLAVLWFAVLLRSDYCSLLDSSFQRFQEAPPS